jgi:TrmH family RNA methyltransferase
MAFCQPEDASMTLTKAQLKHLRDLQRKKEREGSGTFIVEGVRLVREALTSSCPMEGFYYTDAAAADPGFAELMPLAHQHTPNVHKLTDREMETISDTVTAQGLLAEFHQMRHDPDAMIATDGRESVLVALDGVSDPGNLGSIIRSADWFGIQGVLVGHQSVDLYNPKVVRSTMGSIFHVPVVPDVDLLAVLSRAREAGYTIYGADAAGEAHFDRLHFARKSVIVLGNEAWGLSDPIKELTDVRVAIRRYGNAESLNVGVACGILLSGLHRLID